MLNKLLFASLLVACSTTSMTAATSPTPANLGKGIAPGAGACAGTGASLFQIDNLPIAGMEPQGSSSFVLRADGAWTYVAKRADQKVATSAGGCLDASKVSAVKAALEAAPWKISQAEITCMAIGSSYTQYS